MNKYLREPINSITHLSGALLSLLGLAFLIIVNVYYAVPTTASILSIVVYGISLFLLYFASGVYHAVIGSKELIKKWKKLDHSMIYVLIAGTYTPFCILSLDGALRLWFIISIWTFALIGIILAVFFIHLPSYVNTSIYIIMGWLAIIVIYPLYDSLSSQGIMWLMSGGILYTIGGIIYAIKKPNISEKFASHELFHIFVLLGSTCHYWTILKYIILK